MSTVNNKSEKEVIESNKLIAEFMGRHVSMLHGDLCYADWDGMHSVKYHTSWDWLMPVVKKINDTWDYLDDSFEDDEPNPEYILQVLHSSVSYVDIDTAFKSVLNFIQWYNQTKIKTNEQ